MAELTIREEVGVEEKFIEFNGTKRFVALRAAANIEHKLSKLGIVWRFS